MYNTEIEQHKKELKLTQNQREILVGLMLGDGHLETQNNGRTYRLKVEHSTVQAKYTNWLYEQFNKWVLTSPQEKQKMVNSKSSTNIWFNTVSHACFRFYAQQFYSERKKVIPKMIYKLLGPQSLAVWFMDDGSIKSKEHKAIILNTQCFSNTDINRLRDTLMKNWEIESQIRKQSEGNQLLLTGDSAIRFAKIIIPYLLPEFYYKLGKIGLTLLPKL